MRNLSSILIPISVCAAAFFSCSTTRHLPDGELLYAGVKSIEVQVDDTLDAEVSAAVNALLEVAPSCALLGSAYRQSPLPWGLWFYNALYTEREKGFRHWLWNKLKSDPTLVSQINPQLRCRAAEVAMHDEGYFRGVVTYEVVQDLRNPRKAQVAYTLHYGRASRISSLQYMPALDRRIDSIVARSHAQSPLHKGARFSAAALQAEKSRLSALMVDSGYFHYGPAFVRYQADTTRSAYGVALRIITDHQATAEALRPCRVDSVFINLDYGTGLSPKHLESDGFRCIGYRGPLQVKPRYLFPCLAVAKGQTYNPRIGSQITGRLARLNTFKYNNVEWTKLPSTSADTISLCLSLSSTYHYPWTGSIEVKAVYKDNGQVGPGLAFMAQRRNLFGGGELLSFGVDAGYEWNTGHQAARSNHGLLNSYELGGKASLSVPRLQLPFKVDDELPVTTTYGLLADVISRAGFFKMFKATAELNYSFSSSPLNAHIITPLQLTYNSLLSTTQRFDDVVQNNRVLKQSFANQFVPSIRYTYIWDNSSLSNGRSYQRMQFSLAEAGCILDGIMGRFGSHREQGQRQFLWQHFSQFVKVMADLRNYINLEHRQTLAMRLLGGVAYAFGNSSTVPYSEQFFIGGANSLRGFSIRSLGPGVYRTTGGKYAYMDQTGDVKLEANVEWRFPVTGDLYAALFADIGNVWTLRNETNRRGGQLTSSFYRELATDCGAGVRYDLGMLVLRFDVGIPLHEPSGSTDKYYNLRGTFFGNLGYHLAIGYPF